MVFKPQSQLIIEQPPALGGTRNRTRLIIALWILGCCVCARGALLIIETVAAAGSGRRSLIYRVQRQLADPEMRLESENALQRGGLKCAMVLPK
jgi:hypothetical protein